jgi:hypothetical protein
VQSRESSRVKSSRDSGTKPRLCWFTILSPLHSRILWRFSGLNRPLALLVCAGFSGKAFPKNLFTMRLHAESSPDLVVN